MYSVGLDSHTRAGALLCSPLCFAFSHSILYALPVFQPLSTQFTPVPALRRCVRNGQNSRSNRHYHQDLMGGLRYSVLVGDRDFGITINFGSSIHHHNSSSVTRERALPDATPFSSIPSHSDTNYDCSLRCGSAG